MKLGLRGVRVIRTPLAVILILAVTTDLKLTHLAVIY